MKTEEELRSMTVTQLREYADAEGIDLGSASLKDDIILAILMAQEEPVDPPAASEPPAAEEASEGEGTKLTGQEDIAATIGPPEEQPVIVTGEVDPTEFQGEPTKEIVGNIENMDVASSDEAPLVSTGEPNWELMPASVLEVLRAQNMPITTEGLREQAPATSEADLPEGDENEVRAGDAGGTGGSEPEPAAV